jgi:hypothetical protein
MNKEMLIMETGEYEEPSTAETEELTGEVITLEEYYK